MWSPRSTRPEKDDYRIIQPPPPLKLIYKECLMLLEEAGRYENDGHKELSSLVLKYVIKNIEKYLNKNA